MIDESTVVTSRMSTTTRSAVSACGNDAAISSRRYTSRSPANATCAVSWSVNSLQSPRSGPLPSDRSNKLEGHPSGKLDDRLNRGSDLRFAHLADDDLAN